MPLVLYIIWPFLPEISWQLRSPTQQQETDLSFPENHPVTNMLVIPRIGVKANVLISNGIEILKQQEGVWLEMVSASNHKQKLDGLVSIAPSSRERYNLGDNIDDQIENASQLGVYSNPGLPGTNTVIAGHRFQYLPPNTTTFYHLDKLSVGEPVILFWQGERQLYEVIASREVLPEQIEVRDAQPGEALLTLYTCSPLGSNSRRLVVNARMIADR